LALRRRRKRTRNKSRSIALVALILIIAVVGALFLTGFNPFFTQENAPTTVVVIIQNGAGLNVQLGFSPSIIKVVIGVNNTVMWKNEDTTWHTAHSNIPEFDSKMIAPGASFTHTFKKPGSFPYHCDPHPWMTGLVSVIGSGSNPIFSQQTPITPLQILIQSFVRPCDGIEP
jgi:plastocyanin